MYGSIATVLMDFKSTSALAEDRSGISDKAVAYYYPHVAKLARRIGMPADTLLPMWEKIMETVNQGHPDDSALQRFVRSVVILFSHIKPEKT